MEKIKNKLESSSSYLYHIDDNICKKVPNEILRFHINNFIRYLSSIYNNNLLKTFEINKYSIISLIENCNLLLNNINDLHYIKSYNERNKTILSLLYEEIMNKVKYFSYNDEDIILIYEMLYDIINRYSYINISLVDNNFIYD